MTKEELEIRQMCIQLAGDKPAWVHYYWTAYLESHRFEGERTNLVTWKVTDADRRIFPELRGVESVMLYQEDNGELHGLPHKQAS